MIIRARAVVTMDGEPIENGAVAIDGRQIAAVGSWPEIRAAIGGAAVDLGERVLLPGLINAHCHLDYTVLRGAIPPPDSFADWIQSINQQKAPLGPDDYVRSIEAGFAEAAKFGTTAIANLEAFPALISEVKSPPLRTWWFAEMIDVREPISVSEVYATLQTALQRSGDPLARVGLAPHAPFTASAKLYAETAALAAGSNMPVTTHLAESKEEMEMFRDGSGRLFEFLSRIGRAMGDCCGTTPLALLLQRGVVNERWIVAHLNELASSDFELLRRSPRFHVVHCPRSHAYFGHARFALAELRALGFNVCVGTDSLASNQDLSLFAEMQQLWENEPGLAPAKILGMTTANAAAALCQGDALGRIRANYLADLIAIPFTRKTATLSEEIVSFRGEVPWAMVDGRVSRSG